MPPLTTRQLNRATLARQGLLERLSSPLPAATSAIGSFQAQHPEWPPMAAWTRITDLAPGAFERAVGQRRLVRAWLMRTTLHIVAAADFWPMTTVTLPGRQLQFRQYFKHEATDPRVVRRLSRARHAALALLADAPRTMAELREAMAAALPKVVADHGPHYLWRHLVSTVPLVDVPPPDGSPARYGRSWYTTAEAWLGPKPDSDPLDDLTLVIRRYLAAYGPASAEDLVMWLGRPLPRLRPGLERLAGELERDRDETGRALLDLPGLARPDPDTPAPPRFLARWDGLLLANATRARGRIIGEADRARVYTANADVRATFVVDGLVAGTWQLAEEAGRDVLRVAPFRRLAPSARNELVAEGRRLLAFLRRGSGGDVAIGR